VTEQFDRQWRSLAQSALRIAAGLAYFSHGAQKLLGWFGGFGPTGGTADLMTRFGAAGIIETVGGTLLILGIFTRWAALAQVPILASAFFLYHIGQGFFLTGILIDPGRGVAIAGGYEYILLILVATVTLVLAGGGAFAVDNRQR